MWLRSIKLYRIRDGLQRLLGCSDNSAADLFRRLNSFRPLLFDATMDAQRIYGTHEVNLADAPLMGIKTVFTESPRRGRFQAKLPKGS